MKTSELTGAALDWAVAKCEGEPVCFDGMTVRYVPGQFSDEEFYNPSTEWAQGGPIIEREGLFLCLAPFVEQPDEKWMATDKHGQVTEYGTTPLIAAMRCYVASKLGDDVEIPQELTP